MIGEAQRSRPADMGADIGLGVATDPLHFGEGSFQMGAGAIDAGLIRDVADIEIRRPRKGKITRSNRVRCASKFRLLGSSKARES